jgi:hypothetical protein
MIGIKITASIQDKTVDAQLKETEKKDGQQGKTFTGIPVTGGNRFGVLS